MSTRPASRRPALKDVEVCRFARRKIGKVAVRKGEKHGQRVVAIVLEAGGTGILKIVERRVVLRDVADESEVSALVAGGFEHGEVGVVGKKLVREICECVRGRKARVLW